MASGIMQIQYGSSAIQRNAEKVARRLDDGCSELQKIGRRIGSVKEHSSHHYLESANAFLTVKKRQYDRKADQVEGFARQTRSFLDRAENTDKRVATRISRDYEAFRRVTGIGKSAIAAFFEELWKKAKNVFKKVLFWMNPVNRILAVIKVLTTVAEAIKKFFSNEVVRFILKAVGAFILAVVAVAIAIIAWQALLVAAGVWGTIFAILSFAGAAITAASATITMMKSMVTATYAVNGNLEEARRLDKLKTSEAFGEYCEMIGLGDAATITRIFEAVETIGLVMGTIGSLGKIALSFDKIKTLFGSRISDFKAVLKAFSENGKITDIKNGFYQIYEFTANRAYYVLNWNTNITPIMQGIDSLFSLTEKAGGWITKAKKIFDFFDNSNGWKCPPLIHPPVIGPGIFIGMPPILIVNGKPMPSM